MATLAEMITAAQGKVTAAKAEGDQGKIAAAEAELQALQNVQSAGYTHTQSDIDTAVQNRLPDAQTSAKTEERKALAQRLGVTVDKLDEELQRIEQERRSQQTEAQRINQDLAARTQERDSATTERDRYKNQAESARKHLEETLKRQAVERELLNHGVIHVTGQEKAEDNISYLDGAYRLTDLSNVTAQVEVDNEGNLQVKSDVQNAADAAKKTKDSYPAMFTDPSEQVVVPPGTPRGNRGGGGGGGGQSAYTPQYAVPGPQQPQK